jgi:RNA polymerase sigma-70 factor (ECF subfamily)
LTQEFFTRLLDKDWLEDADPQRGRFRSFLLASLRHFLANVREHNRAQKRGGGRPLLSLDFADAERRYQAEPADPWTPEKLYERRWALQLLAVVLSRIQSEFAADHRTRFFDEVKGFLDGTETRSQAEVAAALDMTEGALKTAVHRLRRRYRQCLRDEIALTVSHPDQIDAEMQQLFQALQP